MKRTLLEPLHEELFEFTTPCGLPVLILPKPGFSKTSVSLQVGFGSIDIVAENDIGTVRFPEGIAHFLEHMIFENTERDVSQLFSRMGASVNAYTTFNRTVYYFTTASDFMQPLDLLLQTVFHPVFSEEEVEKERKIITSEIEMYKDDLEQSLYYDVMRLMYQHHPIRSDIAGTKESLSEIDSASLKLAFEVFYHPRNALLVISGDVDPEIIEKTLTTNPLIFDGLFHPVRPLMLPEPDKLPEPSISLKKDMRGSLVMVGLRLDPPGLEAQGIAIEEMKLLLLIDNFFSKSSDFVKQMRKAKLINNNFDFSVTIEKTFGHILFFAETARPEKTVQTLIELMQQIKEARIDMDRFRMQKRKIVGQFVQIFNSTTSSGALISEYAERGTRIDELILAIEDFTPEDLYTFREAFIAERIVSVIYHP